MAALCVVWFALSIPAAVVVGKWLAWCGRFDGGIEKQS